MFPLRTVKFYLKILQKELLYDFAATLLIYREAVSVLGLDIFNFHEHCKIPLYEKH